MVIHVGEEAGNEREWPLSHMHTVHTYKPIKVAFLGTLIGE